MKRTKSIYLVILALVMSPMAMATIIVDNSMEQGQNGWISTGGWFTCPGSASPFFSACDQENPGNTITHSNPGNVVSNADVSLGNHTLQLGTYSIYFATGNWSNAPFAPVSITFAGMSDSLASSSSVIVPAGGEWNLWSLTWDVTAGNTNIGNALSFSSAAVPFSSSNTAHDGVGALSTLGNGFLVDFTPTSVPEPGILVLLGLGLVGIAARRRKTV